MNSEPVFSQKVVYIYTIDRKLHYFSGQRAPKAYPIAVGKPETPTPLGTYHIIDKIVNPDGILGTRWMGLDIPNGPYGIHGTSLPDSIGKAISNGCIRMYNHNAEELFSLVLIGTTVIIGPSDNDTLGNYLYYTVKAGDTLWSISQQFGIPVNELAAFNNIDNPENLQIGQELKIPKK